ncbi:MAG: hypothetical protein AB2799_19605 [Candidatus Thiodiazotropha sp.]
MSDFDFTFIITLLTTLWRFVEDNAYSIGAVVLIVIAIIVVKKHGRVIAIKIALIRLAIKHRKFTLPRILLPDHHGRFPVQNVLCGDYMHPYTKSRKDLSQFDLAHSYLRKACELGRHTMPLWLMALLGALVGSEAVVFSMVLVEYGLDSVTPSQQPFYAGLIGSVLAIVLMLGTHYTGKEWHRNELIKKAGEMGRENTRNGGAPSPSALATNNKTSITNDKLDDGVSAYEQLLNRLHTNYTLTPDWRWTKGTVAFIVILMALSFIVRLSVSDIIAPPAFAAESMDMSGLGMEGIEDLLGNEMGLKASSDFWSATGSLSTLLIFTMIFLGIQALSIFVSRAYGFASIEGREAYKIISKYRTREDYLNHQQALELEIINAAQARLNQLNQRIIEALNESGVDSEAFKAAKNISDHTFLGYIKARQHEEKLHEYEDII